jgi:C-lobe and N-lobe beta barrels of Tf-binding protein B
MSRSLRICAVPVILTAVLAACAGGGGGGAGGAGATVSSPMEVPFSAFDAVRANQTVTMTGISQTGSGTDSAFNLDPVDWSTSSARLTFDDKGNLSAFSFSAPGGSAAFNANDFIQCGGAGCGGSNETATGSVVNPFVMGWNYQSFGIWMDQVGPTTFQAGAMSAGAVTPGSAVPTTSTATFRGHASGFFFDGAGGRFSTDSEMTAITDFGSRSIDFSTNLTGATDMNAPWDGVTPKPVIARPDLNLAGTLNYAAGVNRFSGDVKTQGLDLTGKADGRFYGPSAQEIGGTYGLASPTTGARMLGGFGGKR